jgi:hypothetical protein
VRVPRFAATLATLASLFAAPFARAAPRTSSLSWVRLAGADTCVSTQDLARDVETRLGRSVFVSAAQADLSVEGRIEPAHGKTGWHAVVVLRDAKGVTLGTRDLARDAASCDVMREPLALVVALMIDPDASTAPPPPPAPPPTAPAPSPQTIVVEKQVPVYVAVPAPAPSPPSEPTWHIDVGASLAASVGLLPHLEPGLAGSALLEPPWFVPLEAYGALWLDSTADGGPTFAFAYVGGGLCPLRYRDDLLRLYACASGQLGYLKATSPDSAQVHVAGVLEGRGSLRLFGPISARAGASLVVPILRPSFDYIDAQTNAAAAFRMSAVAATLDAGLGLVMP